MAAQTPDDALASPLLPTARSDLRRRREMALTARWLRELGGKRAAGKDKPGPAGRFARPAKP